MLEITEKDILRSVVVEPAWYTCKVTEHNEEPSSKGDSTNEKMEAVILKNADTGSEEFAGVPISWNFNSKVPGFAIGFLESLGWEKRPGRVDLKGSIDKVLDIYVENDTYQGRLINRVNHKYRPTR